MTGEQALQISRSLQTLLEAYSKKLIQMNVESKKADTSKTLFPDELLGHISWMVEEMTPMVIKAYESFVYDADKTKALKEIDKINRWLGYIQGVLSAQRVYTIDEMRVQNRLIFK